MFGRIPAPTIGSGARTPRFQYNPGSLGGNPSHQLGSGYHSFDLPEILAALTGNQPAQDDAIPTTPGNRRQVDLVGAFDPTLVPPLDTRRAVTPGNPVGMPAAQSPTLAALGAAMPAPGTNDLGIGDFEQRQFGNGSGLPEPGIGGVPPGTNFMNELQSLADAFETANIPGVPLSIPGIRTAGPTNTDLQLPSGAQDTPHSGSALVEVGAPIVTPYPGPGDGTTTPEEPPEPPEPPTPQYAELPPHVIQYLQAAQRANKDRPVSYRQHGDAIQWLNDPANELSPRDAARAAVSAANASRGNALFNAP